MIASRLALRVGSLTPGHRHLIRLDQVVPDGAGRWRRGPHPIGWLESSASGLRIKLVDTVAARTATALMEEGLLDAVLSGYPAVITLQGGPA